MTRVPPRPIYQKGQKPLVYKPARDAARDESCTLRLDCCNGDKATTVLAHLRLFNVAGINQKPPDYAAVFACSACHDAIDRRSMRDVSLWTYQDILRALIETLQRQFMSGIFTTKKESK